MKARHDRSILLPQLLSAGSSSMGRAPCLQDQLHLSGW